MIYGTKNSQTVHSYKNSNRMAFEEPNVSATVLKQIEIYVDV